MENFGIDYGAESKFGTHKELIRWVHTGLFKCTWSAFDVHLRLTCVWMALFSLDGSWQVVLSCQRNFKTSKCRSALSSKVKTLLETAVIQSKHRMFIIKVSIISSNKFHSRKRRARNYWWMRIRYGSPRSVGRFLSVLIHELAKKFHYFHCIWQRKER